VIAAGIFYNSSMYEGSPRVPIRLRGYRRRYGRVQGGPSCTTNHFLNFFFIPLNNFLADLLTFLTVFLACFSTESTVF
jgi:hypothetical protein